MRRSIENLLLSLEREEGKVESRVIQHNRSVLQAILEGRQYFLETLMLGGVYNEAQARGEMSRRLNEDS